METEAQLREMAGRQEVSVTEALFVITLSLPRTNPRFIEKGEALRKSSQGRAAFKRKSWTQGRSS